MEVDASDLQSITPLRASSETIHWSFKQINGPSEEEVNTDDAIHSLEFGHGGDFLAVGDKSGRIVVFQSSSLAKQSSNTDVPLHDSGEYIFYSTFQSHESDFDYLKSLEIEEKINQIKWLKPGLPAIFLLSTNDKTIKLWKLVERCTALDYSEYDHPSTLPDGSERLVVPRFKRCDRTVENIPKRKFQNAHQFHINAISIRADGDFFLSADDLRINLWHMENNTQSFNIVDMKPESMENLNEVITCAEFHPFNSHHFIYGSSKGCTRLADMRVRALCDQHVSIFNEVNVSGEKNFFGEIIESISDVKFSHCGRFFASRDYMNVKIWDMNMSNKPIETFPVHEFVRSNLCHLYENDAIFDRFSVCWSPTDSHLITGTYGNCFRVIDRSRISQASCGSLFEVNRCPESTKPNCPLLPKPEPGLMPTSDTTMWSKKLLHCAWHPKQDILSVAGTDNLFIYKGHREATMAGGDVSLDDTS